MDIPGLFTVDANALLYQPRIRQIKPDLEIHEMVRCEEARQHDLFTVNDRYVFKFSKDQPGRKALEQEARIYAVIGKGSRLTTPTPFHADEEILGYERIPGRPFSPAKFASLSQADQQSVAEKIGAGLASLHAISGRKGAGRDLHPSRVPWRSRDLSALRDRCERTLNQHLQPWQRDLLPDLFGAAIEAAKEGEQDPVLIHGDPGAGHLLCDQKTSLPSGLIGFGSAGLGDAAWDIGVLLYQFGEMLPELMKKSYPDLDDLLPRARLFAGILEWHWACSQQRGGPMSMLFSHLGTIRDLKSR